MCVCLYVCCVLPKHEIVYMCMYTHIMCMCVYMYMCMRVCVYVLYILPKQRTNTRKAFAILQHTHIRKACTICYLAAAASSSGSSAAMIAGAIVGLLVLIGLLVRLPSSSLS
jgi:hypothetical protein